jgi:dTDP-4-amino-4,6-dideoxygalactose transaminase
MIVTKTAIQESFIRQYYSFNSAREAFKIFLKSLNLNKYDKILLPAYIGWSSNEGSGIFDPIFELKLNFEFYNFDENLNIDVKSLQNKLNNDDTIKVVLIVHYFGYVDNNIEQIVKLIKFHNKILIEDCAHAFFNDFHLGTCGRYGHATFYSIHKLFPEQYGGLLVINDYDGLYQVKKLKNEKLKNNPFKYDFFTIAKIRQRNAKIIEDFLISERRIKLIRKASEFNVPQTYPILILNNKRDQLYFKLNELGFGVVSLYHELISEVDENMFINSHNISRNILNLPVHQDISEFKLRLLLKALIKELDE